MVVKHEEVPGFMPAMTMPFDVRDTNELTRIKPGDLIQFRMLITTNDGWIVEFINHGNNGFVVPPLDYENMHVQDQDQYDLDEMYRILNEEVLPLYYEAPQTGCQM